MTQSTQEILAKDLIDVSSLEHQTTVKGLLLFELRSLYGRLFLQHKPKLKNGQRNLLNLGCGITKFDGWVNADFFVARFWRKSSSKPDWMLDLRFPLKCENNVWDGVFSEHTLEHLYPNHALNLLQELHRTMKPEAWIRITVPDLEKYVKHYCGSKEHQKFDELKTGCEAIRNLTQNHIHLSVWDSDLLEKFLLAAGFANIKKVSFMQGTDPTLLKDNEGRCWETLYIEAQKPARYSSVSVKALESISVSG
jgi:predicted SAM-dependent methyltransferase